jgi:hypothetical protein
MTISEQPTIGSQVEEYWGFLHQEWTKLGRQCGYSMLDVRLVHAVAARPRNMSELICEFSPNDHTNTCARTDVKRGVRRCIDNGLIRVVNKRDLNKILTQLHARKVTWPIHGLPTSGDLDITEAGAKLIRSFAHQTKAAARGFWKGIGHSPTEQGVFRVASLSEVFVFSEKDCARSFVRSCFSWASEQELEVDFVSDISEIDNWRRWWWEDIPRGYVVTLKTKCRKHLPANARDIAGKMPRSRHQHRGSTQGKEETTGTNRQTRFVEEHGLTIAEWRVLQEFARGAVPVPILVQRLTDASEAVVRALSESDVQQALTSCVQRDLIWQVDNRFIMAVEKLLSDDHRSLPLLALPEKNVGLSDFSPRGAQLFLETFTHVFGPDTDYSGPIQGKDINDRGFSFHKVDYCKKEGFFCTRIGALRFKKTYEPELNEGERVKGPDHVQRWCSHWWECHPKGYVVTVESNDWPPV